METGTLSSGSMYPSPDRTATAVMSAANVTNAVLRQELSGWMGRRAGPMSPVRAAPS